MQPFFLIEWKPSSHSEIIPRWTRGWKFMRTQVYTYHLLHSQQEARVWLVWSSIFYLILGQRKSWQCRSSLGMCKRDIKITSNTLWSPAPNSFIRTFHGVQQWKICLSSSYHCPYAVRARPQYEFFLILLGWRALAPTSASHLRRIKSW